MVREMREALEESGGIYLTEFEGLTVAEATALRGDLIEAGSRMQVVKNRLLKIAVKGTEYEALTDLLTGPNAVTYCADDPIAPLKVLTEFADDHEQPPVKAGVVDGEMLSPEELDQLASIPGRDELVASVVGGFAGPVNELVFTLSGLVSDLVFTLQAVAEEKGDGQEAA
ncbi:MAG: 50S ribosomal protein L10 [Armatimonadia bacterium]|nr:50S ribosomal protein L10 [Armatimonadia bacterium]